MDFYEDLLLRKFRNKKIIRTVAIVLSIFTFVLVIVLLLGLIIPQLIKIMFSIMYTNPGDIKKIIESIGKNNIVDKIADMMNIDINNIDISGYVTKLIRSVMSSVGNILMGVISGISGFFNTIISVFMAVVFAIYILMDKERIAVQGDKLLRAFLPSKRDSVIDVLRIFNTSFRNYFISQVKEAIILGVLLYIVMIIARLPYASSISILVGVTALIPVIGAYAGLFIGTLMILTKSFSSMIIFIIVHTVVQQFENNIIYPRVVGSSVGLPGMWVIVAVALGGSLGGIFGVFVAVPVAASLYFILKRETLKRL
jgi:putative permease